MIKKQWQIAIDILKQFSGTATGDSYESIEWETNPIPEQYLIKAYDKHKRCMWSLSDITKRDNLLLESDWTQNRDVSLPNDSEWISYRQALRDITTSFDPIIEPIIWPIKPENN